MAFQWGEDASVLCIASVNGTCVLVVTDNRVLQDGSSERTAAISVTFVCLVHCRNVMFRCVDTSHLWVTAVLGARVLVRARHQLVLAVSS